MVLIEASLGTLIIQTVELGSQLIMLAMMLLTAAIAMIMYSMYKDELKYEKAKK